MDSIKRNGKHFTNKDREVLKFILIQFIHILENKRTDASSSKMKSSTWEAITHQFNESSGISEARTAKQLRTLWNNMKAAQRNALTKEKVMAMGTGGGPPPSPAEVDPEVAELVPYLMATAPCLINSNMTAEEMDAVRVEVLMEEEGDAMVDTDVAEIILEEQPSGQTPLPSTSCEREPKKMCRNRVSSVSATLHEKRYNELLKLDVDRARRLKEQDEVLFQMRKKNEEQKGLYEEEIHNLKKQLVEEKLRLAKRKRIEFEAIL